MIPITPDQVTPAIAALFDPDWPTAPRAQGVLAGITAGQILVDDPIRPAWAAVREATYGTLYPGGALTAPVLAALVAHFRLAGSVGIGCWPDAPLCAMLPPAPEYDGRTRYFPTRSADVPVAPLLRELPPGLALVPRDAALFARSFDYADTLATFGTVERVLRYTRGVVLLAGDLVVCEAATGAPAQGRIEVGVTMHPDYRGRGLATVACAALIAACEAEGLSTWWDCAAQNIASTRLARRLGYLGEREYRFCMY